MQASDEINYMQKKKWIGKVHSYSYTENYATATFNEE